MGVALPPSAAGRVVLLLVVLVAANRGRPCHRKNQLDGTPWQAQN
jgi:hypothetical protein